MVLAGEAILEETRLDIWTITCEEMNVEDHRDQVPSNAELDGCNRDSFYNFLLN